MMNIRKFNYIIGLLWAIGLTISCVAEYNFCFSSWLAGRSAYVFILALVAVQTFAAGKIVKNFAPVLYERHSKKVFFLMPIISAAVLCMLLMLNLMSSAGSYVEAFNSAVVFNFMPFIAAAVLIFVHKIICFVAAHHKANKAV